MNATGSNNTRLQNTVRLGIFSLITVVFAIIVSLPASAAILRDDSALGSSRNSMIVVDDTIPVAARSPIWGGGYSWRSEVAYGGYFDSLLGLMEGQFSSSTPPPQNWTAATQGPIDGQGVTLAIAKSWVYTANPGITYSSIITYDEAEDWYNSTLVNIGSSQIDRWGTSTHELGHVLGLGHIPDGSQWCPTGQPQNSTSVMCPYTLSGMTNMRYIFPIDAESYAGQYGG